MLAVSRLPGPAALGRGVIVEAGAAAPAEWSDAPRIVVDDDALREAGATAERLHEHWAARSPVVVDLRVAREILTEPEHDERPPYELTPAFEFARALHFLVRANNYDARAVSDR
jgi:hypothetical protein